MELILEKLALVVAGLAVGILVTWIKLRLLPTARLRWAANHPFSFVVDETAQTAAHTRTLLLANAGRLVIEAVQIVLAHRPQFLQVHPPISFTETPLPDSFVVTFPHFGPRQTVTVEMLAIGPFHQKLPDIVAVRSKSGPALTATVAPQRPTPAWVRLTVIIVAIAGATILIECTIRLLQQLKWLPTPLW